MHGCDESDDIDDSGFQNNNKLNIEDLVIMFNNNIIGSNNEKEKEKEKEKDDDLTDEQLYEYISSLETKNILVKNKNNYNDKNQMYHFLSYIFKIA